MDYSNMEILCKAKGGVLILSVIYLLFSTLQISVTAQNFNDTGCPCHTHASNYTCPTTSIQCPCYSDYGVTYRCQPCQCNQYGSSSQVCNSAGICSCKPDVGGAKCDSCLDESHWWDGKKCRSCDCYDYMNKCKNIKGTTSEMCTTCSSSKTFTTKCSALCGQGLYKDSNNSCKQCPDCAMPRSNSTGSSGKVPTECQSFTDWCLQSCSHGSSVHSQECASCHSSSSIWNCTGGQPAAKAGSGNSQFKNYYIYVAAGGGALLCTALISTIIFVKKRQSLQKPAIPLWTIELKQDDQVSFTDYNDVDVMYLDDSYLMEPSEVFTTSTDSMDERIGYKDERIGYKTLS